MQIDRMAGKWKSLVSDRGLGIAVQYYPTLFLFADSVRVPVTPKAGKP